MIVRRSSQSSNSCRPMSRRTLGEAGRRLVVDAEVDERVREDRRSPVLRSTTSSAAAWPRCGCSSSSTRLHRGCLSKPQAQCRLSCAVLPRLAEARPPSPGRRGCSPARRSRRPRGVRKAWHVGTGVRRWEQLAVDQPRASRHSAFVVCRRRARLRRPRRQRPSRSSARPSGPYPGSATTASRSVPTRGWRLHDRADGEDIRWRCDAARLAVRSQAQIEYVANRLSQYVGLR